MASCGGCGSGMVYEVICKFQIGGAQ
jgi:hypothetical protein